MPFRRLGGSARRHGVRCLPGTCGRRPADAPHAGSRCSRRRGVAMRRTPSALVVVALLAAGCTSSSGGYDPGARAPVEHHLPTPEPYRELPTRQPYREVPAASPYDGVTFQDPGVNPYVDPTRDRESTFGLDVDT